jgi:hypothetical protein
MTTAGTSAANSYVTESNTVAKPVQQAQPNAPVTGTVGHRGIVEYSNSAAATVKETYVVTAKK